MDDKKDFKHLMAGLKMINNNLITTGLLQLACNIWIGILLTLILNKVH
jgi:hypothetical protein